MHKKFFALFIIIAVFILSPTQLHAYEVQPQKVYPNQKIVYKAKRLIEKTSLSVLNKTNPSMADNYLLNLSDKRLAELKYVVEKEKMSFFEDSVSRYTTFLGLIKDNLNSQDKEEVIEKLDGHLEILQELQTRYPSSTAEWRFMQQTIDTARVLISDARQI